MRPSPAETQGLQGQGLLAQAIAGPTNPGNQIGR
jgi:hypothetical protein